MLKNGTPWELLNIPVDEAIDLFDKLFNMINEKSGENSYKLNMELLVIVILCYNISCPISGSLICQHAARFV